MFCFRVWVAQTVDTDGIVFKRTDAWCGTHTMLIFNDYQLEAWIIAQLGVQKERTFALETYSSDHLRFGVLENYPTITPVDAVYPDYPICAVIDGQLHVLQSIRSAIRRALVHYTNEGIDLQHHVLGFNFRGGVLTIFPVRQCAQHLVRGFEYLANEDWYVRHLNETGYFARTAGSALYA